MVSSLPLLPEAPRQECGLELGGVGGVSGACCLEPRRIPSYILSLSLSLTLYKVLSTVFNPAIVLGASYTVTKKNRWKFLLPCALRQLSLSQRHCLYLQN